MAEKTPALTFIQKKPTTCPICGGDLFREEMLTGRGRMIAGKLTPELRRLYEPSKKFGEIYPLIYPVTVCPHCYYAAWKDDFAKIPASSKDRVKADSDHRTQWVRNVIDEEIDFTRSRTLSEGLASYILALACYDYQKEDIAPLIKQGISALRAAWLAMDMHKKHPDANYSYLAKILYRKARFFYLTAIDCESSGKQSVGGCPNPGPDLDQNYMYDGILYMYGHLEFYYGPVNNPDIREENLRHAKQTVARIFGMGKASKDKPTAILDNARALHEKISVSLGLKNQDPEKDNAVE